jgi:hypothetical protein
MVLAGLAVLLALPVGVVCLVLCWHMSRSDLDVPSDSHDALEFILGTEGVILSVLGALFWL